MQSMMNTGECNGDGFQGDVACATGPSTTATTSATPLPTALVESLPTSTPTGAPTAAPTVTFASSAATPSPKAIPTGMPTPFSTSAPTTSSATVAAQPYPSTIPSVASECSIISEGNAVIKAQNFNGLGLLILINLDRTNTDAGNIYQKPFVAGTRSGAWNWNPSPAVSGPFNTVVDFEQLRYL